MMKKNCEEKNLSANRYNLSLAHSTVTVQLDFVPDTALLIVRAQNRSCKKPNPTTQNERENANMKSEETD